MQEPQARGEGASSSHGTMAPPRATGQYPNRFFAPWPPTARLPRRGWLLLALVLLAFVPRLIMCWNVDVVCVDAINYFQCAAAMDQGDFRAGLAEWNLNLLPLILLMLGKSGLDYETAGMAWNVAAGTLVVLPVFGIVRRQFDDRIAAITCVLVAFHPTLIIWSPEIIREPTFWLLAMTGLYLSWRAVEELRLGLFLAAGLVITLAILTRVEGLMLVLPMAFWALLRVTSLSERRWRPVLGTVAAFSFLPGILVVANLLLMSVGADWTGFRTTPLEIAGHWSAKLLGAAQPIGDQPPATAAEAALAVAKPMTLKEKLAIFAWTVQRGMAPVFGILVLLGCVFRRDLWLRSDNLPLLALCLLGLLAMWVLISSVGATSSRYTTLVSILSAPWATVGVLHLGWWLARGVSAVSPRRVQPAFGMAVVIVATCIVGQLSAVHKYDTSRWARAQLGQWVRAEYPQAPTIAGTEDLALIVGYYSGCPLHRINKHTSAQELLDLIHATQPELILLGTLDLEPHQYELLLRESAHLGFERRPAPDLQGRYPEVVILARRPSDESPATADTRREPATR